MQGIHLDPEGVEIEFRFTSKEKSIFYSKNLTKIPGLGRSQFEPTGQIFPLVQILLQETIIRGIFRSKMSLLRKMYNQNKFYENQ